RGPAQRARRFADASLILVRDRRARPGPGRARLPSTRRLPNRAAKEYPHRAGVKPIEVLFHTLCARRTPGECAWPKPSSRLRPIDTTLGCWTCLLSTGTT